MLRSGRTVYPDAIERHYRHSPFIHDIGIVGLSDAGDGRADRLGAVVVPDRERLRERRIVNVGEIVRFEMEGRGVLLPPHDRVAEYRISMAPLVRMVTGALRRDELERHVRDMQRAALSEDDRRWMESPAARPILRILQRAAPSTPLHPDANLELDLGLDSMARVELLAEIQSRLGARVPDDRRHSVFTVRDLVEGVRPYRAGGAAATAAAWDTILAEGDDDADPSRAILAEDGILGLRAIHGAVRLVMSVARLGIRWTVSGTEHLPARGPYLLCPNHQSYMDPFVVAGLLPFGVVRQMFYLGATEYLQHPLAGWGARQVRLVPVDPDAGLVRAMQIAAFGLRRGRVLLLFPEGERSADGTVRRFKKGAAILSHHLRVPIVPVALDGCFDLWPRNRPFSWSRLRPWRRHRIDVRIGPPLLPGGRDDRDRPGAATGVTPYAAITSALRDRVAALWDDIRRQP